MLVRAEEMRDVGRGFLVEAEEMRDVGRGFLVEADLGEVLLERGPGVYTVTLTAELEGGPLGETVPFAEHSVFVGVEPPAGRGR